MRVFFTDLDGTFLDHDTYSYEQSLEGVSLLKKAGIPLILVSSKTFSEMKILHEKLKLDSPLVFEGGGGIALFDKNQFRITLNGEKISVLRKQFHCLESYFSVKPLLLIDMPVEDVIKHTGLTAEKAALAQKRQTSIPFLLPGEKNISQQTISLINKDLQHKELRLTRGGRFFHFSSINANKGFAIDKIISLYDTSTEKIDMTAAAGDSENDIPMLKKVTCPYLVRKKGGVHIETHIANVFITQGTGPAGFTEAVKDFLSKQ